MEKRLSSEIVAGFAALDTACISDALDRLGIRSGLLGIHAVLPGTKLCGQAFTVHYTACGAVKGTVGDFIDDVAPGDIVVIDNGGRLDCTVWGDIMSLYATVHGIGGTVIDGVCRDVDLIRELNYPIFTKSTYMVTGKDRVYVDAVGVPVTVSGTQVVPGDLMVADGSGALVVPFERCEEVLEVAREIEAKEEIIKTEVRAGHSLKAARAKTGYHTLQTRR